jgi:hypothetical protein
MKTLFKFAMVAALAGALVKILMQKQAGNDSTTDTGRGTSDGPLRSYDQNRTSQDMAPSPDMAATDEAGADIRSSGYGPSAEEGARSQDWNGQRSGF